jgi:tripartite-type tricarboxylate transporter receptor subunit TctC
MDHDPATFFSIDRPRTAPNAARAPWNFHRIEVHRLSGHPMKKFLLAALAFVTATSAMADFPDKPISLVVPFSAGGPTDKLARHFSEALRKQLGGKAVVNIDYVAGAGGTQGATKVAKSDANGYTLLFTHVSMATAPALHRSKLGYNALEDFEYLGLVNEMPMTLVGRPTLEAKTYPELAKWMQANKGKVRIANAGAGSASHLCGLLLMSALKLNFDPLSYKGAGPAMIDVAAGQADLICDQTANTLPQIESGKVQAYAVTSAKRLGNPVLAKLPTLDEVGLKGFQVTIWHGLYAPKGTPKAVADKLNAALRGALKDPEFMKSEKALGAVPIADARSSGAKHKKFVEGEIARWTPVIEANKQYAD